MSNIEITTKELTGFDAFNQMEEQILQLLAFHIEIKESIKKAVALRQSHFDLSKVIEFQVQVLVLYRLTETLFIDLFKRVMGEEFTTKLFENGGMFKKKEEDFIALLEKADCGNQMH